MGVVSHVFTTDDSCLPDPALCRSLGDVCDRDVEEDVCVGREGGHNQLPFWSSRTVRVSAEVKH